MSERERDIYRERTSERKRERAREGQIHQREKETGSPEERLKLS